MLIITISREIISLNFLMRCLLKNCFMKLFHERFIRKITKHDNDCETIFSFIKHYFEKVPKQMADICKYANKTKQKKENNEFKILNCPLLHSSAS